MTARTPLLTRSQARSQDCTHLTTITPHNMQYRAVPAARIMPILTAVLVAVSICAACTTPVLVLAQSAKPKSAASATTDARTEELVSKVIEAQGRIEKLRALKTAVMTGRVTVQGALEGRCTLQLSRPKSFRVESTVQGFTIVQGFDGKSSTAWVQNPLIGVLEPKKAGKNESKQLAVQAEIFDSELVDYKQKGNKVQLLGKESVETITNGVIEGVTFYKLKITKKNNETVLVHVDASTYLPIKHIATVPGSEGNVEMTTVQRTYKDVDGVKIPFAIEQTLGEKPFIKMIFEDAKLNQPLDESLFALPKK